jgi:hypothetical protein|tara:strand:- start:705 stop:1043 length:339 start_codon:yes stop_codon:yes gene_type:complete
MAKNKDLVPYSKLGSFKSKIRVSGEQAYLKYKHKKSKLKKGIKDIASKTTGEQRFLGKTLPKTLFKVGKFAFMNPITAAGLYIAGGQAKKLGQAKSFDFPEYRQFNKKGRKI